MIGRPVIGDPVTGDPVIGGPVIGGPVIGGPVIGGPVTGRLTTHVLDAARGRPGAGIPCRLSSTGPHGRLLYEATTNQDGRCEAPLLEGASFVRGTYELVFAVAAYLARHHGPHPEPPYLDEIVLRFGIAAPDQHYHVALLVSPYSYTTYRGS